MDLLGSQTLQTMFRRRRFLEYLQGSGSCFIGAKCEGTEWALHVQTNNVFHKNRLKTAATLLTRIKEKQSSVIRFFFFFIGERVKPRQIHRQMKVKYGDACLLIQRVYGRSRRFHNGVGSVTYCSLHGRSHRVVTIESIATVKHLVQEHHRFTVSDIAAHHYTSQVSAHRIIHEVLQLHKVSARWELGQLTPALNSHTFMQELLQYFEVEGESLLSRIVT